jgi:glutamate/tyrosine decarboxylase-like PLP-dependent enzyme
MPSPLDLDQATMQRLGRQVADHVAAHLAGLRDQPIYQYLPRAEAERLIAAPPPAGGESFETLLGFLEARVLPHHAREPHPGFLAYVQGCPTFPAILGDWLASGYNFFGGAWRVASGPAMLELTVLDWFRRWIGMPEGAGGLLTSGGSSANLMAIVAARHAIVGEDPSLLPRLTLYCSDQTHSSVTRAAWIAGVPRAQVRSLPVDDAFRLRLDALRQAIAADRAAGFLPLAVVASAGTTNTGATDPLPDLATLCRDEGVWLHADAAYGGFAMLTGRGQTELAGLGLADSVTLDPHKWLYMPFECGSLLLRDPRRLFDAFHILPEYLRDLDQAGGEVNFADYGEQLTRYARALKVWLGVSYYGTDALAEAIEAGMQRAELGEQLLRAQGDFEILSPARLAICCFRYNPAGLPADTDLDGLNQRLLDRLNAAGRFFLSTTRLRGVLALRICCCGHRTTTEDMGALVAALADAGERETERGRS